MACSGCRGKGLGKVVQGAGLEKAADAAEARGGGVDTVSMPDDYPGKCPSCRFAHPGMSCDDALYERAQLHGV